MSVSYSQEIKNQIQYNNTAPSKDKKRKSCDVQLQRCSSCGLASITSASIPLSDHLACKALKIQ